MKQHFKSGIGVPTANITINKNRLKIYDSDSGIPTYYLQKNQEFEIELFNPTTLVVLAKITLNGKMISQGGLVLNPGERVFLDRFFDIPKRFLFDTYEVSNTEEVKKAIENNGDIKIQFFKEREITPFDYYYHQIIYNRPIKSSPTINYNNSGDFMYDITYTSDSFGSIDFGNANLFTTNSANINGKSDIANNMSLSASKKSHRKIETGRVEAGSTSNQKFQTVDKDFELLAFHVIEYKLLPVSQKINTVDDLNVKRYCTNCGSKTKKTDKFCSKCGEKL